MPLPERVRLVVLFGGRSAEHDVSCITAAHVLRSIDHDRYDTFPIAITRDGDWMRADEAINTLAAGTAALPERLSATGTTIQRGSHIEQLDSDVPVVVLPLLHGPHGEDGTIQGLLELAGVPYVGSGVLASALAMDKAMAKDVAAVHGIPQCGWSSVRRSEIDDGFLDRATDRLGYPMFVKPANMGSSVGVTRVEAHDDLRSALEEASRFDEWLVVEEAVVGRELECAVLGNDSPRASVVGEVRPGGEFYDYDDKYVHGTAELLVPAPIPSTVADELRDLAVRTFRVLRCQGLARIDFFWEEDGRGLLLNEVNTIPGFTPVSMYPKLWEATGLPYARLVDELVALALERHHRRAGFDTQR